MEIHDELASPICARCGGVRASCSLFHRSGPAPANILVVARASVAPTLSTAMSNDAAWATAAPSLKVSTVRRE